MARGRDEHLARQGQLNALGKVLARRAKSVCELCEASESLQVVEVPPVEDEPQAEKCVLLCSHCQSQLDPEAKLDVQHWFCLHQSIWSDVPAVQVLAWRLLQRLASESWAQELLEQVYLDPEVAAWAAAVGPKTAGTPPRDSNGQILADGDTVHIIKDLDVKGVSFVAKRGTVVKNIRTGDDPELVEGRVNNTSIMLKTVFLKKVI